MPSNISEQHHFRYWGSFIVSYQFLEFLDIFKLNLIMFLKGHGKRFPTNIDALCTVCCVSSELLMQPDVKGREIIR